MTNLVKMWSILKSTHRILIPHFIVSSIQKSKLLRCHEFDYLVCLSYPLQYYNWVCTFLIPGHFCTGCFHLKHSFLISPILIEHNWSVWYFMCWNVLGAVALWLIIFSLTAPTTTTTTEGKKGWLTLVKSDHFLKVPIEYYIYYLIV